MPVASLAQLAEHALRKRMVAGSIPQGAGQEAGDICGTHVEVFGHSDRSSRQLGTSKVSMCPEHTVRWACEVIHLAPPPSVLPQSAHGLKRKAGAGGGGASVGGGKRSRKHGRARRLDKSSSPLRALHLPLVSNVNSGTFNHKSNRSRGSDVPLCGDLLDLW